MILEDLSKLHIASKSVIFCPDPWNFSSLSVLQSSGKSDSVPVADTGVETSVRYVEMSHNYEYKYITIRYDIIIPQTYEKDKGL